MRSLVAHLYHESNTFLPSAADKTAFDNSRESVVLDCF
jgi:microcystin degradation protein MlrC